MSGVFLRGANRGQTLVLIDGVRIASSSAGSTSLEAIPLDQIDRIEILRGPASSLYGADAIGGVVQVFTRRGTGALTGNASAGYGTYRTWDVKGGVSGATGPVQFALQAAAKASNGFNTITNPANFLFNPDPDGYSNRSVSANVGFTAAPEQELTAQYFRSRLDNQFDGGPDFDDRTITVAETWQVASRNRLAPFWVSRLSAGAGIDDSAYADGVRRLRRSRRRSGSTRGRTNSRCPLGALTAGFERREEHVATDAGFATTERNTNSLFGIYQLRVDDHALQANLRRDDSSQYGGKTTGAFTYGYRFAPSLRVTAGYATGFKAPSFNDLYYPGFANPDLVPETSKNLEAGVYWNGNVEGASLEARAIVYRNRVSQLIVFQCDADFNCAPHNVDRATLEGVTLGLEARADNGATITASLDLQSPEDDRHRQAPAAARAPARRPDGGVSAGAGARGRGADRVVAALRRPGQSAEDGRLRHRQPHRGMGGRRPASRCSRAADNVFDKNYELAAGYATGGATVFAGVRALLR